VLCPTAEMLENLKIALKKQKKLIVIFLLTIFLPALSLGVFGIRAIKSERFRQAKQLENEQRRLAEGLKSRVSAEFRELGLVLQNLAEAPACQDRDDKAIADMIRAQLVKNPLVETVFYYYEDEEPRFPAFHGAPPKPSLGRRSFSLGPLQGILDKANENEFITKDYGKAIAQYREIGRQTRDNNTRAQMFYNESRCLVKLDRYAEAIKILEKIDKSYPEAMTTSGVPLALVSQLETVHCYRALANIPSALKAGLDLYRGIIEMRWVLREAQFKTYASLVEEAIEEILSGNPAAPNIENLSDQYARLKTRLRDKNKEWTVINAIQQEVVPDLRRRQSSAALNSPIRHSKTIGDREFLVLASPIIGMPEQDTIGLVGLTIKESFLLNNVLAEAIAHDPSTGQTEAVLSDLEGRILLGKQGASETLATVTEFFDDNFPPWKMEFFQGKTEGIGFAGLKNSFYFWTILTLVVVLVFGAVLIGRTIAHEMEILKLKSDFVSSVSHEFKTPLTSIKALAERLQGDKVIDATKMKQYFSLISQNADQLSRLVKNLLDFSKIEEGKIEYSFVLTDIAQLVSRQVQDFAKNDVQKNVRIRALIPDDIPHLYVNGEALSQALNNLLDNAFKFSSADGEVEVRVKKDGDNVVIEVADQGIGIPQDEQGKIFEKFYQARNAVRQSAKGTGLGLTMVKHMAEAHGGRISVKSKFGEGSVFSLTLPINKE
jgi:tetratricopeptide (TPR) repeat protein